MDAARAEDQEAQGEAHLAGLQLPAHDRGDQAVPRGRRVRGRANARALRDGLYTGGREGEIAALEWADVDFENRLITIQRSFDGPTKADDLRYVPILDVLLPIVRAWRLRAPGRLLFTNRDGRMFQPSARVFQEALHRVLKNAGFEKVVRHGKERHYIRFHDLRHTFASHWVMA